MKVKRESEVSQCVQPLATPWTAAYQVPSSMEFSRQEYWSGVRRVQLFATPWTVARQAPLSMEFSRQEYWNGLLFVTPGHLPDLGIEPVSLISPALAGRFFTTSTTWEALILTPP